MGMGTVWKLGKKHPKRIGEIKEGTFPDLQVVDNFRDACWALLTSSPTFFFWKVGYKK